MSLNVAEQDQIFVIQPHGPALDLESHAEIRETLKSLSEKPLRGVVLDLTEIERIDSLGLGSLISGRLSLRGKCDIHLCCMSNQVESLVRHSRMDLLFPIHENLRSAVATIHAEKPL